MATITKSIRIAASCQRRTTGMGGDCVSKVTGDTDYCSYTTTTTGSGTPSSCSSSGTTISPCLVGMSGEPVFQSVTWDASLTSDGHTYTRISTTGGSNSATASATYEYEEPEPEPEPTYYTLTINHYLGSTSDLYKKETKKILEGTRVDPSDYTITISGYTFSSSQPSSSFTMSSDRTINLLYTTKTFDFNVNGVGGVTNKSCNLGDVPYHFPLKASITYIEFTCQRDVNNILSNWSTSKGTIASVQTLGGTVQNHSVRINFSEPISLTLSTTLTITYSEPEPVTLTFKYNNQDTGSNVGTHNARVDKGKTITTSWLSSEINLFCPAGYNVISYSPNEEFVANSDTSILIKVRKKTYTLTIIYEDTQTLEEVSRKSLSLSHGTQIDPIRYANDYLPSGYEYVSVSPATTVTMYSDETLTCEVRAQRYGFSISGLTGAKTSSWTLNLRVEETGQSITEQANNFIPANYQLKYQVLGVKFFVSENSEDLFDNLKYWSSSSGTISNVDITSDSSGSSIIIGFSNAPVLTSDNKNLTITYAKPNVYRVTLIHTYTAEDTLTETMDVIDGTTIDPMNYVKEKGDYVFKSASKEEPFKVTENTTIMYYYYPPVTGKVEIKGLTGVSESQWLITAVDSDFGINFQNNFTIAYGESARIVTVVIAVSNRDVFEDLNCWSVSKGAISQVKVAASVQQGTQLIIAFASSNPTIDYDNPTLTLTYTAPKKGNISIVGADDIYTGSKYVSGVKDNNTPFTLSTLPIDIIPNSSYKIETFEFSILNSVASYIPSDTSFWSTSAGAISSVEVVTRGSLSLIHIEFSSSNCPVLDDNNLNFKVTLTSSEVTVDFTIDGVGGNNTKKIYVNNDTFNIPYTLRDYMLIDNNFKVKEVSFVCQESVKEYLEFWNCDKGTISSVSVSIPYEQQANVELTFATPIIITKDNSTFNITYKEVNHSLTIEAVDVEPSNYQYGKYFKIATELDSFTGNIYYQWKWDEDGARSSVSQKYTTNGLPINTETIYNERKYCRNLSIKAWTAEDGSDTSTISVEFLGTDWALIYNVYGALTITYIDTGSSYEGSVNGTINVGSEILEDKVYISFIKVNDKNIPSSNSVLALTNLGSVATADIEDAVLVKPKVGDGYSGFGGGNFNLEGGSLYVYTEGKRYIGTIDYTTTSIEVLPPTIESVSISSNTKQWAIRNPNKENGFLFYKYGFDNIDSIVYSSTPLSAGKEVLFTINNTSTNDRTNYISAYIRINNQDSVKTERSIIVSGVGTSEEDVIQPIINFSHSNNVTTVNLSNPNTSTKNINYRYRLGNSPYEAWQTIRSVAPNQTISFQVVNEETERLTLTVDAYIDDFDATITRTDYVDGVGVQNFLTINYYFDDVLNNSENIQVNNGTIIQPSQYIKNFNGVIFSRIIPSNTFVFNNSAKIDIYYTLTTDSVEPIEELRTRWITPYEFKEATGIDLNLRLKGMDNPSRKADIFIAQCEDDVEAYLQANFFRSINFEKMTDFQKENFRKGMIQQILYIYKNGDIANDSGYDPDRGIIARRGNLEALAISPKAIRYFKICGLWNRHIKGGRRFGNWGY